VQDAVGGKSDANWLLDAVLKFDQQSSSISTPHCGRLHLQVCTVASIVVGSCWTNDSHTSRDVTHACMDGFGTYNT